MCGGKSEDALPGALRNNPGKTASPYNLPEHPYLKGQGDPNCPECRRQGLVPPGRRLSDDNHDGREDELCPLHRLAQEESLQKEDSKRTTERLLPTLRAIKVTLPEFEGQDAVFVRNSITENLRYGKLYEVKKEVGTFHIQVRHYGKCKKKTSNEVLELLWGRALGRGLQVSKWK